YLGEEFDIHTGGIDHREIHHVNEIAQNQAYLGGSTGVRYWMHNEFLLLGDEKMSKSSGQFVRLETLVEWGIHPLVYRYFLLAAHYRSKLTFSFDALVGARSALLRTLRTLNALSNKSSRAEELRALVAETRFSRGASFTYARSELSRDLPPAAAAWIDKLDEAISRDLNTAAALASLTSLVDDTTLTPDQVLSIVGVFDLVLGLGLLETPPEALLLRPAHATLTDEELTELVKSRDAARASGNYKLGDEIRDRLKRESLVLSDSSSGTRWEWVPSLPK
ncbi:MAG TPA: class I tRNA ligase family protein, partial [Polyangiaceae bacterium]